MTLLTPDVRAELGDLLALFAWSLDQRRYDKLREVFTPDVRYRSGRYDCRTVEELVARFQSNVGNRTTRHCLGNLLLTGRGDGVVDGYSVWQTWAVNRDTGPNAGSGAAAHGGPVRMFMVADFTDQFVRTGAGWRIAQRTITPVLRDPTLAPGV